jgi:fatty acid synthase subunit alpha
LAVLSGGLSYYINLRTVRRLFQDKISLKSEMNRSVYKELLHESGDNSSDSLPAPPRRLLAPKARIQVEKASLPDYQELQPLAAKLQDMVDLERVVVVVGFGEVSKCNQPFILCKTQFRGHFS